MSTTLERNVAMGYAAGDPTRMGIVMEVQQGMVNRGASISDLSQYPHEREILFGPLTGIEVLGTRIDGSLVVIECGFSINLSASRSRRCSASGARSCATCASSSRRGRGHEAEGEAWAVLKRQVSGSQPAAEAAEEGAAMQQGVPAVEAFIKERLMAVAEKEPKHNNENAPSARRSKTRWRWPMCWRGGPRVAGAGGGGAGGRGEGDGRAARQLGGAAHAQDRSRGSRCRSTWCTGSAPSCGRAPRMLRCTSI